MGQQTSPPTATRGAHLRVEDMPAAIEKLNRRLKEVREMLAPQNSSELSIAVQRIVTKVNATYAEIYGAGTAEYNEAEVNPKDFFVMVFPSPWSSELETFRDARAGLVAALETKIEIFEEKLESARRSQPALGVQSAELSEDVFVVHGHDEQAREEVVRLITRCGLNPITLHEQASGARTVIEKLERYSNVSFALVLLTPDDVGGPASENVVGLGSVKPRARQNVIAELFYFIGKLGRDRVCTLMKGDIEIPSDIGGVVYTPMDAAGAWKMALLRELTAAGHEIDWERALS